MGLSNIEVIQHEVGAVGSLKGKAFPRAPSVYQNILAKAQQKCIPTNALFELTYKCNLKCAHCYVVEDKSRKELSFEEVCDCLGQLAELGVLYLVFSGGEILTRPDFFDIARYARKKGFALTLFTNGTLIDSSIAEKIKELYPRQIEASLYGATSKNHDGITGVEDSFEKLVESIKQLTERRIKVVLKSLVLKQNVSEFSKLSEFAKSLGAKWRGSIQPIAPKLDGSKDNFFCQPLSCDVEKIMSQELLGAKPLRESLPRLDDYVCGAAKKTLTITPYGDVMPCAAMRIKGYNLGERALADIWRDAEEFNQIRNLRWQDLTVCKDCQLLPFCFRCSGQVLQEGKKMTDCSEQSCSIARMRKEVHDGFASANATGRDD